MISQFFNLSLKICQIKFNFSCYSFIIQKSQKFKIDITLFHILFRTYQQRYLINNNQLMSSTTLSSQSRSKIASNDAQQQQSISHQNQQSQINQPTSQQQIQKMKQQIQLSKQQLINLVNRSNLFHPNSDQFAQKAKKLIDNNKIEEALIYLNQAEKILEYAASSGRNIQRKAIVEVLHNLACCYQILWDLEKCSNYIEALIFNFNSELKFSDFGNQSNPQSEIHMSGSKKSIINSSASKSQICSNKLQKKLQLSKYYLLYCAMNSQLKNNQGALISAKKASQLTKSMFCQLKQLYSSAKQQSASANPSYLSTNIQQLPSYIFTMLQQIVHTSSSIPIHRIDQLYSLVRHYIKIYNSKCLFNNLSASKSSSQGTYSFKNNNKAYQKFKQFSIGNIMQLHPIGDNSESQKIIEKSSMNNFHINFQKIIQILIVFSICQFTMATQLRYIALGQTKGNKQKSKQLLEFRQSQTYHLLSILLISMYMPFDILYMEHIISSYHTHYQKVLLSNGLDGTPELLQDDIQRYKSSFIFPKKQTLLSSSGSKKEQDHKKCSTTNQSNDQSLIVSFHDQQNDQSKQKTNSGKKSSGKKYKFQEDALQQNDEDIINKKSDQYSFDQQNNLFDEYYYAKKNTQTEDGLCYEQSTIKNNARNYHTKKITNNMKNSKSKSFQKIKNLVSKGKNNKIVTEQSVSSKQKYYNQKNYKRTSIKKNDSTGKHCSIMGFQSKPSKFIRKSNVKQCQVSETPQTYSQRSSLSKHKIGSQIISKLGHSPVNIPQIYSKIVKNDKISRNSKSKQNNYVKVNINKNNFDNLKHESQYFNKCKDQNQIIKKQHKNARKQSTKQNINSIKSKNKNRNSKSRSNKKSLKKQSDEIKIQYFHVHNPNIIQNNRLSKKQQSVYTSGSNNGLKTMRKSQSKKQRLSSNSRSSLQKNGLSSKIFVKKNLNGAKECEQIKSRLTTGDVKTPHTKNSRNMDSQINRRSISNKKSQRNTYHYSNFSNINAQNTHLKTQQSTNSKHLMKASHFDRYYL